MKKWYVALSVTGLLSMFQYTLSHAQDLGQAAYPLNLSPPPPPVTATVSAPLYLELIVNGARTNGLVLVRQTQNHLIIHSDKLREAGIKLPESLSGELTLDAEPLIQYDYDIAEQKLKLTVPTEWLEVQLLSAHNSRSRQEAQSNTGALLNYDLYSTHNSSTNQTAHALWLEQRVFGKFGSISNTGIYRRTDHQEKPSTSKNGYIRYDTTWTWDHTDSSISVTIGDLSSGSLAWGSSVRLGGVQVRRNFTLRPDIITTPLLEFNGSATVPSTLDLFINGSRQLSTTVQPGPFTLNNLPSVNGAGNATIVTTDALGRQITLDVPFYTSSTLLKPGIHDFSLSYGMLRENYGIESNRYNNQVVSGTSRYGVNNWWTAEGRFEGARSFRLAGVGSSVRVARLGTVNFNYSLSDYQNKTGSQRGVSYSYNNQGLGFSIQHTQRGDSYTDLSRYAYMNAKSSRLNSNLDYTTSRRSTQITGSLDMGAQGALSLGYFNVVDTKQVRTRLLTLSHSIQAFRRSNIYTSVNKNLDNHGYALQMQWFIPLQARQSLNFGASHESKQTSYRVNYSLTPDSAGGWGTNLSYSAGNSSYRQADVSWQGRTNDLQVGVYGSRNNYTYWGGVRGAMVIMDGTLLPTRRIGESFAVVSTEGYPDIGVSFENQNVGNTNSRGYLLIPNVNPFTPSRYAINTLGLPANVQVKYVENLVAIKRGSGAVVKLPVRPIVAASIKVVDENKTPLTLGLSVKNFNNNESTIVGWDGLVYLEDLEEHNRIQITLADKSTCSVTFSLILPQEQTATLGPLICQKDAQQ